MNRYQNNQNYNAHNDNNVNFRYQTSWRKRHN